MIDKPGIYDGISESDYHSDPVTPMPSLSSSVAKLIVSRSPLHAWFAHPRLNTAKAAEDEKPSRAMDIGTAAHKIILGEGKAIQIIEAADYRTKDAQAARDSARAAGRVPVLKADFASVKELAEAAKDQIACTELAGVFDAGTPEATLAWLEGPSWCRARVDWLPEHARAGGHITVVDVKTTGGSAHPDDWARTAFDMGYDVQAVFYERGLRALIPGVRSVRFKFLVIEQEAPYGLSVNEMSGQAIAEAEELVRLGIEAWTACRERNDWPGYPSAATSIDPPKWRSDRTEIRRLALLDRIGRWQRPLEAA